MNSRDDDLSTPPIVAIFFENDGLVVIREQKRKRFFCLVLQLEPIDQKKDTPRITRAEKQLDYRGSDECLTGTSRHFKEETVFSVFHRRLNCLNRSFLIRP